MGAAHLPLGRPGEFRGAVAGLADHALASCRFGEVEPPVGALDADTNQGGEHGEIEQASAESSSALAVMVEKSVAASLAAMSDMTERLRHAPPNQQRSTAFLPRCG